MALVARQGLQLCSQLLFFRAVNRNGRLIHSKPAKGKVGPLETVIGLTVFSLAILGPAGWFLSHISSYKMRRERYSNFQMDYKTAEETGKQ